MSYGSGDGSSADGNAAAKKLLQANIGFLMY